MKNNKKYTAPELEIIDIDCEDIIQTSSGLKNMGDTNNDAGGSNNSGSGGVMIMSTGAPTEVETDFFK